MPVSVALTFPAGRFHATPWGHHVNEALPEWPPSPWRFLRALVAVWKRKLPRLITQEAIEGVLAELAKAPPAFSLPPATLGHTRHYMPLGSTDGSDRVKVFDAFVALAYDAEVVFHWADATLKGGQRETLALLLSQLGHFGRAESWCAASLCGAFRADAVNCTPGPAGPGFESVRVLAADPTGWNGWAFTDRKVVRPDPAWNLLAETADLHRERWSDPPGSRWISYARPADGFATRPSARLGRAGGKKTDVVAARFVVDVAEGRRPLPPVTQTLPFAEEVRRELGRQYARVIRGRHRGDEIARNDPRLFSQVLYGKDDRGAPARSHGHAFYLPTDEDGDGRIDHVTVYADGGFYPDDLSALDRLRSLSFGKEGQAKGDGAGGRQTTHRLLLVGLEPRGTPHPGSAFGPSNVWVSATPYVAFRHLKRRGRKRDDRALLSSEALPAFMAHVLTEDWQQRDDLRHNRPSPKVEFLADPQDALGWRDRSLQFYRARSRRGDDGYSRPFGTFRLTFPRPVPGPLSLGYACHFGMGAFRAAPFDPS